MGSNTTCLNVTGVPMKTCFFRNVLYVQKIQSFVQGPAIPRL